MGDLLADCLYADVACWDCLPSVGRLSNTVVMTEGLCGIDPFLTMGMQKGES